MVFLVARDRLEGGGAEGKGGEERERWARESGQETGYKKLLVTREKGRWGQGLKIDRVLMER